MSVASTLSIPQPDQIRLHITPLSQSLFDAVIPKTVQHLVTSRSFHSTQNDPEKGFGYVTLPKTEADKIRKKLNGLYLRGSKMSIQEARPERKRAREEVGLGIDVGRKKSKRVKVQQGEIAGYELPANRKVKRGWTEDEKATRSKDEKATRSKDKKSKREKSKYRSGEEVLFKLGKGKKKAAKTVGDDTGSKAPKKMKKDDSTPTVIHEFETTTKVPSFLRAEKSRKRSGALSFVDEQGWTDEDGNVVEPVSSRRKPTTSEAPTIESVPAPLESVPSEENLHVVDSPLDAATVEKASIQEGSPKSSSPALSSDEDSDPSTDSASESGSNGTDEGETTLRPVPDADDVAMNGATAARNSQASGDSQVVASAESAAKPVHPLEALYKRRADGPMRPAPIDTSFSFFGQDEHNDEARGENEIPQTPFTQRDVRMRGMRSAAPTPDTAAIDRKFSFAFANKEDEEDEELRSSPLDEQSSTPAGQQSEHTSEQANEESDFVKAFYEKRGEQNQSWKQKRREALKQQRQRDNRRLSRRAV